LTGERTERGLTTSEELCSIKGTMEGIGRDTVRTGGSNSGVFDDAAEAAEGLSRG